MGRPGFGGFGGRGARGGGPGRGRGGSGGSFRGRGGSGGSFRGRGGGRGGRGGRGGMRGGTRVAVVPHRHEGVFIAKGREDALVTRNLVPGESVYGEKRINIDGDDGEKVEYRVWNPFRSKLAAAIVGGIDKIHIRPGSRVLYLGAWAPRDLFMLLNSLIDLDGILSMLLKNGRMSFRLLRMLDILISTGCL
eukprot:m.185668 g.185668  ORF g.185668 m.185668 type:complete len:192 (+) comp39336_c0_seq106:39-614(+)